MNRKRLGCSLLLLACMVQAGCAGARRHPLADHDKPHVEPAAAL